MDPILLPKPRELDPTGEGVASLGGEPRCAADRTLPAQGFALEAGPEGVAIRYADDAGLRYARAALEQLRAHPEPLPSLRIRDWLAGRDDLELVTLPEADRKNTKARRVTSLKSRY